MGKKKAKIALVSSDIRPVVAGLLYLGAGVFILAAILGDQHVPPVIGLTRPIQGFMNSPNRFGWPGAFVAGVGDILLGDTAALLAGLLMIWGICAINGRQLGPLTVRLTGAVLFLCMAATAVHLVIGPSERNPLPGGMVGVFITQTVFAPYFGPLGSVLLAALLAVLGLIMATGLMVFKLLFVPFLILRGLARVVAFHAKRPMPEHARRLAEQVLSQHPSERANQAEAVLVDIGDPLTEAATASAEQLLENRPVIHIASAPEIADEDDNIETLSGQRKEEEAATTAPPVAPVPARTAAEHSGMVPAGASGSVPEEPVLPLPPIPDVPPEHESRVMPFPLPPVPEPQPVPVGSSTHTVESRREDSFEQRIPQEEVIQLTGRGAARQTEREEIGARQAVAVGLEGRPVPGNGEIRKRPAGSAVKSVSPEPEPPARPPFADYRFPDLELFARPKRVILPNLREKLGEMAERLEETLRTFGVEARVTDVCRGPTVTRFELEPAPGVKVNRFVALTDDIALALKAVGVRVEAPIPGKARVGIEISNEERDPVVLRELLEHSSFRDRTPAQLLLPLGKGISGEVRVADLTKMPHLLVAGATGSGKTVFVKALIAGLLMQHHPNELQLMLIDPKMVELSIFNDIPHLITPVVTDPKKAAAALGWLISEMEERYKLLAENRARNIEVYNQAVENGEIACTGVDGADACSIQAVRRLPYIVCVIDELADLMMLARAEVEDAIARLAQLARAVGIHLILATQRPSVDVLTGVIKANFPARISFQVSSRVDSRCILDEIGAERLVGMGDMLYLPAGRSKPERIQGAFVGDAEMEALVEHLRAQGPPQYRPEIERFGKEKETLEILQEEEDPLYEDAVRVVLETGQASISMVQRRLRVGYTRAARLIDMMELRGIVGPHTGSKAREILVSFPPGEEEP